MMIGTKQYAQDYQFLQLCNVYQQHDNNEKSSAKDCLANYLADVVNGTTHCENEGFCFLIESPNLYPTSCQKYETKLYQT